MLSIDEAAARLHAKGWSTGDVAMKSGEWAVSCTRTGVTINEFADSQTEAWIKAWRRAEAMDN